jgi:hypothetical protein
LAEKPAVGLLLAAGLRVATFHDLPGIVAAHERAVNALRQLTEAVGTPQPGTPDAALLKQAIDDYEMARLAVLTDLHRQLHES